MNSNSDTENVNFPNSNINNSTYLKSKYDSLNSWLDNEDAKYSMYSTKIQNISNNDQKSNNIDVSKKDVLNNINRLIDDNNKKDQFIFAKNTNNKNNINYISEYNNINTSDILGLTLELNETKKTNKIMKETIQDLKSKLTKNELDFKENLSNELNKQKYDYEEKIQNLKDLISNLMSEKKELNNNISDLNSQIDNIESKYKKKISELNEYHNQDNKKSKDAWFQAEKFRRKKWEESKIKEIKEMHPNLIKEEENNNFGEVILNDDKNFVYNLFDCFYNH